MPDTTHTFIPFIAKRSGTQRLIEGPITADVIDIDGQRVSPEWLKSALPRWMQFGNVREQHDPKRAVGKAQTLNINDITEPRILAKISDGDCWQKIEDGVYSGFSLGIRNARIVRDGGAPNGTIVGGDIIEISVVDHPAVHKAAFTIVNKVAGGWQDMQSGIVVEDTTQAERIRQYESTLSPDLQKSANQADEPEDVSADIIRKAKARRALPTSWEEDSATEKDKVEKMPAYYDEEGNPVTADTVKAAFPTAKDKHKGDEPEDGSEDPKANGKDKDRDKDGDEDGEDEEDDFTCPRCHKDSRECDCYKGTNKAAADFNEKIGTPKPIGKGNPLPKGQGTSVSGSSAMHDDSGRNAPFDGNDARVRLDYTIKQAETLVHRMQEALDGLNSASFNPNDTAKRTLPPPAGDPNHGMGGTPDSAQDWHGIHATTGTLLKRGMEEAEVYKIAADVSQVAIERFFADTGFVTKGASPNPTKAAFAELIKTVATDVAWNISTQMFDQLEERVAKVERSPLPSKGIAAQSQQAQAPQSRTYDQLSPQEQHSIVAEVTKAVGGLHDTDQTALLAELLSRNWASPQPYATPQ